MAQINTADHTSIYQIKSWLGLNESPAGDTVLKMGEAAVMRNFRITREGHLQIRPGYAPVCTLAEGCPVRGLWSGYVNGGFHFLAACGGRLWDIKSAEWSAVSVGEIDDAPTTFFGFGQKVYLLTGAEYYCWDGNGTVASVEGYVPVVSTAVPPEGGGTLLERTNLLTGKRRSRYSPDGTATVFHLPEQGIDAVLAVEGTDIKWTADTVAGTVTFESAPPEGVNTLMFTWETGHGNRKGVTAMRFAETYNGDTDTRVFLYGDGTNNAIYSDLDEFGVASAEYFPEMNAVAVDSANTPVTAMIRHYDRLMVYKPDGAFCIQAATALTLDTGEVTATFTCSPVNREIGNIAPGQVRLIANNPVTLYGRGAYQWSLSSAGSRDERNAKCISQRVEDTFAGFELSECVSFDDEEHQELYIICGERALVYGYGTDAWYYYTNFAPLNMSRVNGLLLFGTQDGRLMHFSRDWHSDNGAPIDAKWESGAMDFGADWRRKYSANIWIAMEPESQGRISVTVQSDRKSDYPTKEIAYSFATFANANFAHWSFNTSRKPKVVRAKLKVKKFTFYKLIFSSISTVATATVLGADLQIRYTGNVK